MNFKEESSSQELVRTISRTRLLIKKLAESMLIDKDYVLTIEQVLVLHMLGKEEGLNLGEVAKYANRERTTISRMVDGLEKRYLVVRVPDKIDKRQKLLYLTSLGQERLKQTTLLGEQFYEILYENISKKDVEFTLVTLKKMLLNIEK